MDQNLKKETNELLAELDCSYKQLLAGLDQTGKLNGKWVNPLLRKMMTRRIWNIRKKCAEAITNLHFNEPQHAIDFLRGMKEAKKPLQPMLMKTGLIRMGRKRDEAYDFTIAMRLCEERLRKAVEEEDY